MAKNMIFLIHGMGVHEMAAKSPGKKPEEGWSKPVEDLLRELYGEFRVAKDYPFDAMFECKPLYYDNFFNERRKQWAEDAEGVLGLLTGAGLEESALGLLTTWAKESNKDGFLRTHVLDVLLYRFFPNTIGEQIRDALRLAILAELDKVPRGELVQWSLIAHSLGTAVIHDTLHEMFSPRHPKRIASQDFRCHVLVMLANVSRVLQNTGLYGSDGDVYRSVVHPAIEAHEGVCAYYMNCRNAWDPIPRPKMFDPPKEWPDADTRSDAKRYEPILLEEIENEDVHGFEHYLRDPKVHIPLFERLTFGGAIEADEVKAAKERYAARMPWGKRKDIEDKLKDMLLDAAEPSWADLVQMLRKYRDYVGALK